ncbi:hypothetical protein ACP275_08G257500 [Erythranthe tilingii]
MILMERPTTVNSALRLGSHLVQSLSVVFLYWFYVFS